MKTLAPESVDCSAEERKCILAAWSRSAIGFRLAIIRRIRDGIAAEVTALVDRFPSDLKRSRADSITAEVLPLAEACHFLELEAKRILSPRRLPTTARPFWLSRVEVDVQREPLGVVLIIGPSNYPLFLAGVQTLQALVAGNAVLIKPGRGGSAVLTYLAKLAYQSGLPRELLTVLDEEVGSATEAIEQGVDKIILTGSVQSGVAVLRQAAEHVTPAIVELSGDDAVFVQASADLERAARAIAFGSSLNGGQTCIAPRRVFVHAAVADQFRALLNKMERQSLDVITVADDDEALVLAAANPFVLGAAVFGKESDAVRLAEQIRAGVVVINDVIVPTADPRVSFGGAGLSGFGTTRGEQGLREMTRPKTLVVQRAKRLRHLDALPRNAEAFFSAYLQAAHSGCWAKRFAAWRDLARSLKNSGEK